MTIDTRTATVLHQSTSGVDEPQQNYKLVRIYDVDGGRVRINVHIDSSYPKQSQFFVETWLPGGGWTEVTRIYGADPALGDLPSGHLPASRGPEKRDALDVVASELLRRAMQVIAP
jgi:hypothetical protein